MQQNDFYKISIRTGALPKDLGGWIFFMKKPDTGKASPLRYLVFIHDNRMLAERAFYCFNLFRLPALSDILRFFRCHRFASGVLATAHPRRRAVLYSLVMEQSDSGKYHCHVVLVTAFDDRVIADGAAGLCNVFYAALMCAFDVIGEREECVGAQGYISQLV